MKPKEYLQPGGSESKPLWKQAGSESNGLYEAWISVDPFRGGVRVLITGPFGFERSVQFAVDEEPGEITERVRATLDE